MQAVSKEYKLAMQEIYRDHSYMYVTIGLVNHQAQNSAYVPDQEKYTYYSNLYSPLNGYEVSNVYAVCDQGFTKVDGSMFFMPREKEGAIFNQGIVSKDLSGSIEIRFDTRYEIKGLTVDFGRCYPVDFVIESDNNAVTVSGNRVSRFVTEEVFSDASYIKFIPSTMKNGNGRLRIHQITMGVGLYFDSNKIISAAKKEYVSPIMETLPNIDFDLTINNRGRMFDVENDKSSINFLRIGQKISVQYGQKLKDGTTEWQQGAVTFLREWSADDNQMNFRSSDRFDDMDGTYHRGLYRSDGISLYDLAVDVLADAGVDTREYWLDDYLKKVKIYNAMPPISHKQALQLIANAGRSVLGQDRSGHIYIRSSFLPDMVANSDNAAYYANTGSILDKQDKVSYASASADYTDVMHTQYFLPRQGGAYLSTGYISEAVADDTGAFSPNPLVEIKMEARYKCFGLTMHFGRNYPKKMVFKSYLSGELEESYEVDELKEITYVDHEFPEFDKLLLEFVEGKAKNRVVLDRIVFGSNTDYKLNYGTELLKTPKGTQLEQIKELQVIRTIYVASEEKKELSKVTVQAPARHTFYFTSPVFDLSCEQGNIIDKSSYFATVEVTRSGEIEVVLRGKDYVLSESKFTKQLNPTGKTEEWGNPLISSTDHAKDIADWVGSYLRSDRVYDISYRGEPRIDANDIMYLENKYVPDLLLRVYEHTLRFNGALSGTIKARRDVVDVAGA